MIVISKMNYALKIRRDFKMSFDYDRHPFSSQGREEHSRLKNNVLPSPWLPTFSPIFLGIPDVIGSKQSNSKIRRIISTNLAFQRFYNRPTAATSIHQDKWLQTEPM